MVFQNDSIQNILSEYYVLLRYDAENDKVFHLSKKHHVSSYPTAVVINQDGFVVNRKYGFSGENFNDLSKSVMAFTNETKALYADRNTIKGYSNQINLDQYPQFYIDYINRDNTKVNNSQEFKDYWKNVKNPTSEEFFSTLIYFAGEVPDHITDLALKYKDDYYELYGKLDAEILFYFLSSKKFNEAISTQNLEKFEAAKTYAYNTLSQEWTDDIIPKFEIKFLKTENKWNQVFDFYLKKKINGDLSNGEINQFCWEVYEKCDDYEVIKSCINWMDEITQDTPTFYYLDTYAFLCFKYGDLKKSREIAESAIKIGKAEKKNTSSMEELLDKL